MSKLTLHRRVINVAQTLQSVHDAFHRANQLAQEGHEGESCELHDKAETVLSALILVLRHKHATLPVGAYKALDGIREPSRWSVLKSR